MGSFQMSAEELLIINTFTEIICRYWYIFLSYLFFNIVDWITGMLKSIKLKKLSSSTGVDGILKKMGLWIVIIISFCISYLFNAVGKDVLHLDLSIMYLMGWYTMLTLLLNEIISILENLVELNVNVPTLLIKSLKVTNEMLGTKEKKLIDKIR